ncbi:MAG: HupE/UreJ family protein [Burkholderiales bacterium]|nr:HupE/UreJ family protein [Burkholderiales bacterium]
MSSVGHPAIGLDHAAFTVCAGLLLALVERGLWAVAALTRGSLLGAAIHLAGVSLPASEAAVAMSVILIATLVMAAPRIGLS